MRTLGKVMLLAVLALPMGSVFAANASLEVDISVTIQASVDVTFSGVAGTTRTLTLTNTALNTTYASNVADPAVSLSDSLDIVNNSTTPIKIVASAVPTLWTLDAASNLTRDHTIVTIDPGTTSNVVDSVVAGAAVTFAPAGGTLFTRIDDGVTTSGVFISIKTPKKVSTVLAPATVTVTLAASAL